MLKKKVLALIFALFVFMTNLFPNIILEEEIELMENLLSRVNLTLDDMNFLKDWSPSTSFKIPLIVDVINNPLKLPEFTSQLKKSILQKNLNKLTVELSEIIFTGNIETDFDSVISHYSELFDSFFKEKVKKPKDLFSYIEFVFEKTHIYHQLAFKRLSDKEKDKLTYLSYQLWQSNENSDKYTEFYQLNNITEFMELELYDYENIILKIDWRNFTNYALVFNSGVDIFLEKIGDLSFNNSKPIVKKTRWGKFCIGSINDDVYKEPFTFILEPSGNDTYKFDLNTDFKNPFYLIVDLEGNDTWDNQKIGGIANVIGGIGWLVYLDGDDFFNGGDRNFSSFFGYQYTFNKKGDNYYKTGEYSLAAATFGLSFLVNQYGNDIYYNHSYGQGFGGTMGAGVLIDFYGHDLYYSGGKYFHDPLRPDDFRTLSQAFGFGIRPDWGGGIGVIMDTEGNDTYQGGVYAQGAAYWYALGILIDLGGNDFFNAVQYAQGSGIHLAGGLLYNKSGNDKYFSRFGPGQGAGHDYAVGFLIDGQGDDFYSIDGGNGLGLTNSVGVFIDRDGDDFYERMTKNNYGSANLARHSGGIGIFMDLGGKDSYPDSLFSNNKFWTQGFYGVGIDTVFTKISDETPVTLQKKDSSDIDSMTDIEEIFNIASQWAVGDNVERVRKAQQRLLKFEEEAAHYIFENHLNTKSGITFRALENFTKHSDLMKELLIISLDSSDSLKVKNSIALVSEYQDPRFIEKIFYFIENNLYIPTVLSALGKLDAPESIAILKDYIFHNSEYFRVITARSLKNIDSKKSRQLLNKMRNDESFLIKSLIDNYFE